LEISAILLLAYNLWRIFYAQRTYTLGFVYFRFIWRAAFAFLCAALHFIVVLSCVWGIECVCPGAQDYGPRPRQFIKPSSCGHAKNGPFRLGMASLRGSVGWPLELGDVLLKAKVKVTCYKVCFPNG